VTDQRRVAIVTGASSGIGKAAAKQLAKDGWHVVIHGRDAERLEQAKAEIRAGAAPDSRVDSVMADLCLLSDVARMADEIGGVTDRVDVLLANAGGVRDRQIVTEEGNEATFAGNHLGHFLLTNRLLPLMRKAAANQPAGAVRIVNVSSRGHMACQNIDWNDLQGLQAWHSVGAYGVAKLANILFAKSLAKRLAGDGIVAHAVHPGVVASNFASHGTAELQAHMAAADTLTPETAASDLVWLALDPVPGQSSGLYWHERNAIDPSPLAQDNAAAERLWAESDVLLARAGHSR
jgi:NAD(P)-dependent dehydrogenase (short-subunit alcohol dehydrogenase family)